MEEEEAVVVGSVPGLEIKDMDLEAVVDLGLEAVVDMDLEVVEDMDLVVVVVMDLVVGDMGLEVVVDMEGVSAQGVTILEVDGVKMTLGSRVVGITHGREEEEVLVGVGMVGAGIKEEMMDGILVEVEVGT